MMNLKPLHIKSHDDYHLIPMYMKKPALYWEHQKGLNICRELLSRLIGLE